MGIRTSDSIKILRRTVGNIVLPSEDLAEKPIANRIYYELFGIDDYGKKEFDDMLDHEQLMHGLFPGGKPIGKYLSYGYSSASNQDIYRYTRNLRILDEGLYRFKVERYGQPGNNTSRYFLTLKRVDSSGGNEKFTAIATGLIHNGAKMDYRAPSTKAGKELLQKILYRLYLANRLK